MSLTGPKINSSWPRVVVKPIDLIKQMKLKVGKECWETREILPTYICKNQLKLPKVSHQVCWFWPLSDPGRKLVCLNFISIISFGQLPRKVFPESSFPRFLHKKIIFFQVRSWSASLLCKRRPIYLLIETQAT